VNTRDHNDRRLYSPVLLIGGVALFVTTQSQAAGPVQFELGLSVGQRDIEYDLSSIASETVWRSQDGSLHPGFSGANVEFDFDETLYIGAFTASALYRDTFVSVALETSLSSEDAGLRVRTEPFPGPGMPLALDSTTDFDLERIDYSITVGQRVWRGLSLFGGYRYTEFELKAQGPNILQEETDSKYTEEGFFLGTSYSFRVGEWGALSFSLGYAFLDVDFSQSNVNTMPVPEFFALQEYSFNASATGTSYGIAWTGNLTGDWGYQLSLKHQDYSSDDDATSQGWLLGENFPAGDPGAPYTSTDIQHTEVSSDHSDTTFLFGILYRM
jgi:hypothetical protein